MSEAGVQCSDDDMGVSVNGVSPEMVVSFDAMIIYTYHIMDAWRDTPWVGHDVHILWD